MFYAYSTKYETTFTPFESREDAIAFLADGDENFWICEGKLCHVERLDYTKQVFNNAREAVSSMVDGDEYSLPGTLRALALAFEESQEMN